MAILKTTQVYLEKDGKYLMLLRNIKDNDINEGKWIAAGGKFEEDEDAYSCAKREVLEETGVDCKELLLRAEVEFENDYYPSEKMYVFTCDRFEKVCEPTSREGTFEWIDKDKLMGLNMWEGDRYFLEYILKDEKFFRMRLVYSKDILTKAYLEGKLLYDKQENGTFVRDSR